MSGLFFFDTVGINGSQPAAAPVELEEVGDDELWEGEEPLPLFMDTRVPEMPGAEPDTPFEETLALQVSAEEQVKQLSSDADATVGLELPGLHGQEEFPVSLPYVAPVIEEQSAEALALLARRQIEEALANQRWLEKEDLAKERRRIAREAAANGEGPPLKRRRVDLSPETVRERLVAERERWVGLRNELNEIREALGRLPPRTTDEEEEEQRLSLSQRIKERSPKAAVEENLCMQELLEYPPTMEYLMSLLTRGNTALPQLNIDLQNVHRCALAAEYRYHPFLSEGTSVVDGDLVFSDTPLSSSDQTCRGLVCFNDHAPCNVLVVEVKAHSKGGEVGPRTTQTMITELRHQVTRAVRWWANEYENDTVYGLSILKVSGSYYLELQLPDGLTLATDSVQVEAPSM